MSSLGSAEPDRWPPARLGDRSLFSALEPAVYVNHAAVSPLHDPGRALLAQVLESYATSPDIPAWAARRERLRPWLAELVGADGPEDIGLVPNTSAGLTHLALGLDWRPGQAIVLMEGDFPANVIPWQQAARLFALRLVWLPRPTADSLEAWLEALDQALAAHPVACVALSAVMFQSGLRLPLHAIGQRCHDAGALFVVDGIQAVGATPLSMREAHIDALSCGGHKWLMGLEGAGFLAMRSRARQRYSPRLAGWLGPEQALDFLSLGPGHLRYDRPLRRDAAVVEGGTQHVLGYALLERSLELLLALGVTRIFDHVNAYLDALEPQLIDLGLVSLRAGQASARSCICSWRLPDHLDLLALWRALAKRGVACATPDGLLRISPHWPNPLDEPDALVHAMRDALRELDSL